jgi:hypothetical protein
MLNDEERGLISTQPMVLMLLGVFTEEVSSQSVEIVTGAVQNRQQRSPSEISLQHHLLHHHCSREKDNGLGIPNRHAFLIYSSELSRDTNELYSSPPSPRHHSIAD